MAKVASTNSIVAIVAIARAAKTRARAVLATYKATSLVTTATIAIASSSSSGRLRLGAVTLALI